MKEYQAAEYLGIKTNTLKRYRYTRTGPEWTGKADNVSYKTSDLDKWHDKKRGCGRPELGDQLRVRLQVVIKPRLKSKLQQEAQRLGLSEGAYVEKLIEGN